MRKIFIINHDICRFIALRTELVQQYQVPIETVYRIPLFDTTTLSIADLCNLIQSLLPKTFINDTLFDPIRDGRTEDAILLRKRVAYFLTFLFACQRITEADDGDGIVLLSDKVMTPQKKIARERLQSYLCLGTHHLRRLLKYEDMILLSHHGISYKRLQQASTNLTPFTNKEYAVDGFTQSLFVPTQMISEFALLLGKNGAYLLLHNLKCFESSLEEQVTALIRSGAIKTAALAFRLFLPCFDT